MKYEIVRTADDSFLVFNGKEVIRYDYQLRLRGPIDIDEYLHIKKVIGFYKTIEAEHRVEALNLFVDSEKQLAKTVLNQIKKGQS